MSATRDGAATEMSVLVEMGNLIRMRPSPHATSAQLGAYYAAKARLHRRVALLGGAEADAEWEYANAAQRHAEELFASESG